MKTVKGPAIFLAQFVDQKAPFNTLDGMCKWAADLGVSVIPVQVEYPQWCSVLSVPILSLTVVSPEV
jgi:hypothetical protein